MMRPLLLVLLAVTACGGTPSDGAGVQLTLTFDDGVTDDQLAHVTDIELRVPEDGDTVDVPVPASSHAPRSQQLAYRRTAAATSLTFDVTAVDDAHETVAAGQGTVTLTADRTVALEVVLYETKAGADLAAASDAAVDGGQDLAPEMVVDVPASIDATGAADVTAALNDWIATVPDGSTISFTAGGTYRLTQGIQIVNRHGLTLDGNGATLRSYGSGADELSSLIIVGHEYGGIWSDGNSGIVIRNFNLVGSSPTPGVFIAGQENQHGIVIDGGSDYDVYGNTVTGIYGDAFFTDSAATTIRIHDNHVVSAGRNGYSDITSTDVIVQHNRFDQSGYVTFDLEPNDASEASAFITFSDNVCGGWGQEFFALDGSHTGADIHDVTVTGNVVTASLSTRVDNGNTAIDHTIKFTNNTSDVSAAGPVLSFAYVDGLTVTGNTQPLSSGTLLSITSSTNVVSAPNP